MRLYQREKEREEEEKEEDILSPKVPLSFLAALHLFFFFFIFPFTSFDFRINILTKNTSLFPIKTPQGVDQPCL